MTRPLQQDYGRECARYLRLLEAFTLDQAAALWCGGDPGADVEDLRAAAPCFTIKRELLEQTIRYGKLPITRDGDGRHLSPREVALNRWRIMRADLIAWFEALPTGDRPAFLFDDDAADELPDLSEIAEATADRAIAVMAWLLSEDKPAMRIGGRPNAAAIGEAVNTLAKRAFGDDVRGLASFNKRVSRALKSLDLATNAAGARN
jgi:hypothetical protein